MRFECVLRHRRSSPPDTSPDRGSASISTSSSREWPELSSDPLRRWIAPREQAHTGLAAANIGTLGRGLSSTHPSMSDSTQTTLSDYVRVLWRARWLVLLVTLLCAGAAIAYSVLKTPTYQATAQL